MANQRIEDLLKKKIEWEKEGGLPKWRGISEGEECQLLMNDFPDEPLYTLKWREGSLDLDDAPASWLIPRQ
jgi:hypothetical protein